MSAESSADGMARLAMGLHEASEKVEDTRSLAEMLWDEYQLLLEEHAAAAPPRFTGFDDVPWPPKTS